MYGRRENQILIVEDEAPLRNALRDKFTREKFTVFEARNGQQGLDLALKKHPDCVLLDIVMPIMDGMSVLKALRDDEWGRTSLIILLTNLSEQEKIAEAVNEQAYDYLVKADMKIDDVVTRVKERLNIGIEQDSESQ